MVPSFIKLRLQEINITKLFPPKLAYFFSQCIIINWQYLNSIYSIFLFVFKDIVKYQGCAKGLDSHKKDLKLSCKKSRKPFSLSLSSLLLAPALKWKDVTGNYKVVCVSLRPREGPIVHKGRPLLHQSQTAAFKNVYKLSNKKAMQKDKLII